MRLRADALFIRGVERPRLRLLRRLWPYLAIGGAVAIMSAWLLPQLGWNLVAEVLGVIFGLFVIDQVIGQVTQERLGPAHQALMREGQKIHLRLMSLIDELARSTATPAQLAAFTGFDDVASHLGSISLAKLAPRIAPGNAVSGLGVPWSEVLPAEFLELQAQIDRFMARYVTIADPELLDAVQQLERLTAMLVGKNSDALKLFGRLASSSWVEAIEALRRFEEAYISSREHYRLPDRPPFTLAGFLVGYQPMVAEVEDDEGEDLSDLTEPD